LINHIKDRIMETPYWLAVVAAAAVIACAGTVAVWKWLEAARRRDAQSEAQRIIAQARSDAQTLKAQASLDAKEAALTVKSAADKELAAIRDELRGREKK